ncbi:hypothetical protein LAC81_14535 [Ensifer adhaerens]|uniref:hypothetical protein n=1 Tax=Ensifer adhaerens TaxID=106592 RepID=UPI001CBF51E0|nr:hypothetical protein [Ensifer adhaerens]MBZ7923006.1 hypothetical protein [Ensifer adhaerens]UAX91600.1 hypothetical protein LAC78_14530 [Ensifer adhaerens]UAX99228.1 hypothetical protein LAC80_14535 [Ensifer adhaerens]UAY06611.1 hypothetical protein LAC81_14535 [Ensifer adhaerens]
MEDLEAARRRYPDRPINRVGDTQEPYIYLVLMSGAWMDGKLLTAQEIAMIEAFTPGCFS